MEELGQIELRSLQTLGNPADSRTSTGKITLTSKSGQPGQQQDKYWQDYPNFEVWSTWPIVGQVLTGLP